MKTNDLEILVLGLNLAEEENWDAVFSFMARQKKSVIQSHHISYDPEIEVRMYKGEHWAITQLNRRKKISRGFITALKNWIALNEHKAVEL